MKIKYILLTFFLILFTSSICGQIKLLSKKEFDEKNNFHFSKTDKVPRIQSDKVTFLNVGKVTKVEKTVIEYESSNRSKWTVSETKDGKTKITLEIIYFDGVRYERKNQKEWVKISKVKQMSILAGDSSNTREIWQYASGKSLLNGKQSDYLSSYQVTSYQQQFSFLNNIYWINSDGLFTKKDSTLSSIFPHNVTMKMETDYNYDVKNIKIEMLKKFKEEK